MFSRNNHASKAGGASKVENSRSNGNSSGVSHGRTGGNAGGATSRTTGIGQHDKSSSIDGQMRGGNTRTGGRSEDGRGRSQPGMQTTTNKTSATTGAGHSAQDFESSNVSKPAKKNEPLATGPGSGYSKGKGSGTGESTPKNFEGPYIKKKEAKRHGDKASNGALNRSNKTSNSPDQTANTASPASTNPSKVSASGDKSSSAGIQSSGGGNQSSGRGGNQSNGRDITSQKSHGSSVGSDRGPKPINNAGPEECATTAVGSSTSGQTASLGNAANGHQQNPKRGNTNETADPKVNATSKMDPKSGNNSQQSSANSNNFGGGLQNGSHQNGTSDDNSATSSAKSGSVMQSRTETANSSGEKGMSATNANASASTNGRADAQSPLRTGANGINNNTISSSSSPSLKQRHLQAPQPSTLDGNSDTVTQTQHGKSGGQGSLGKASGQEQSQQKSNSSGGIGGYFGRR